MTSTMTTHAYVNETNLGENSFFRVPNDGIPDGARGIRFMLDFDPSNINKEPILIAERLINAMQKGNVSTSMEKLLCQLEKFAS